MTPSVGMVEGSGESPLDDDLEELISKAREEPQATAARLLSPLDEGQQFVVDLVAELFFETVGEAPTAQFVHRKLEHAGFEADRVMSSFPRVAGSSYRCGYGAWTDGWVAGRDQIGLTAVGLFHCGGSYRPEAQRMIDGLLSVVRWFADCELAFVPAPFEHQELEVSHHHVLAFLERSRWLTTPTEREPFTVRWSTAFTEFWRGKRLPDEGVRLFRLMERETFCWFMQELDGRPYWYIHLSPSIRRYADVHDVQHYVTEIASFTQRPDPPGERPATLPLPVVLDYLDCVWRLVPGHDDHLVVLPGADAVHRLGSDATGRDEFATRMSALADVLGRLRVPPVLGSSGHAISRLRQYLLTRLDPSAHDRIITATDDLSLVLLIRHGSQHASAEADAARASRRLGLDYPINDWRYAWDVIRARAATALNAICQEISRLMS
jgi:hypothetical protein